MSKNEEAKKPIFKKWWFWVIVVLAVIVIAGMGGNNNTNTVSTPTQSTERTDSQENKATEKEKTKVNVGEEVSTNNTKITFVSANDYTNFNDYTTPKSGNKVIRVEFSFENTSTSDIYLNGLDCYADGEKCENYYSADDYKSPTLEGLSSGKKAKAIVYYEVPENAESIIIEYETSAWTSDKIEFIVK